MKITMYELLGMVKDGKAPKKIMFLGNTYRYDEIDKTYRNIIGNTNIGEMHNLEFYLDDEVEILEEEPRDINVCGSWFTKSEYDKLAHSGEGKKIPKKLGLIAYADGKIAYSWSESEAILKDKINEIIDCLNSKGDE